ncbi:MAG: hypothetical protein K2X48_09710 [Chitinophagaceae bacterium]|nr:hypothetical protein [Chitinophagaceae bacterium]
MKKECNVLIPSGCTNIFLPAKQWAEYSSITSSKELGAAFKTGVIMRR